MIFLQKSLPLPKTSRQMWTMSSAWESSLAKMSVLGTSVRPGKSSVNSASLEGLQHGADLRRDDDGAVELRARCMSRSSSSRSQRPRAGLLAAAIDVEALLDLAALLGDLRVECGRRRSRR